MLFDIQAEFEAKKAKEKVTNLDGENEVGVRFFKEILKMINLMYNQ